MKFLYVLIATVIVFSTTSLPATASSDLENIVREMALEMKEMRKEIEALKKTKKDNKPRSSVALSAGGNSDIQQIRADLDELRERQDEGLGDVLSGVTLGGYGEVHYNNFKNTSNKDKIDFHRFVLFFGKEINDWITFKSELEVEHALSGDGQSGAVELEQAYLDFQLSQNFNVRSGMVLVPIGIINETHEPPTFYGVERPDVDKNIIPTTWREAGIGIFGDIAPGLKYKIYYVSSLDAADFTASSGLRGGRQNVASATAEDFAIAGRLEFTRINGLKLGASFFTGDTSQGVDALGDARVTILEADAQYSIGDFDMRGLYAATKVGDAGKIKAVTGEDVGEKMVGWYLEGAWRMMGFLRPDSEQELAVFTRYSEYNTQDELPDGVVVSGANDVEIWTVGLDYKPAPNVVFKIDYQDRKNNDPSTKAIDQLNIGVGYSF
jgi:Sec-independent protein translocase protein TatA